MKPCRCSASDLLRQLSGDRPCAWVDAVVTVGPESGRKKGVSNQPICSYSGWHFDLVLLGGRAQLEGHRDNQTISCWVSPCDSLQEVAAQLLLAPTCCLERIPVSS